MKISIIWWTGGFGLWLAKYIRKNFKNLDLIISWIDSKLWESIAKENAFEYMWNKEASSIWDIVIFAVPISKIESVIKDCAPRIKDWAIAADICSIKWFTSDALKKYSRKWVTIIPTHPMFWPYVDDISWQILVITPVSNIYKNKKYLFFKKLLKGSWMKVIESTPEYHDKMMAVVQWLTHINMFAVWESIRRLWIDVLDSLNFVSPIYKMMIASVARYIWHNANLYVDIQMYNSQVKDVHKIFMNTLSDFNKCVEDSNSKGFLQIIEKTQKYFWDETSFWQNYTDKIIYLMWTEQSKIRENIWKPSKFKNIYDWTIDSWIVSKIDWDIVTFDDWRSLDLYKNILL